MRKWVRILAFIALILGQASQVSSADAASPGGPSASLKDIGYGDIVLRGGRSSADVWFPGPGPVQMNGAVLDLKFNHSGQLDPEHSSLVVSVNDHLLSSIYLTDANRGITDVKISIPPGFLKTDQNHLSLGASLSKVHAPCTLTDDQSLWVTVFSKTQITYSVGQSITSSSDLKDFPAPFINSWLPQPSVIELYLPRAASSNLIGGALTLAADLGQAASGRPATLQASSLNQLTTSDRNVIALGLPNELSGLATFTSQLPYHLTSKGWQQKNGSSLAPDQGVIALLPSPWQADKSLLIISGSTDVGLAKAIDALGSKDGRATLTGDFAIIQQFSAGQTTGSTNVLSLSSLGFANQRVSGTGNHTVDIRVPLTRSDAAGPLRLQLRMRASPLLEDGRSSVQVYFDNHELSALRLPTSQPDQINFSVNVPSGIAQPGFNTLSLDFFFYLPPMGQCGAVPQEQAWASVLASSTIDASAGTIKPAFDLAALPYPLVGGNAPTLFVVPDDPQQWAAPLQVAFAVGRDSQQALSFQGLTASQFNPKEAANREVVVCGTPNNNRWVSDVASRLPVGLSPSGQRDVIGTSNQVLQTFSNGPWGLIEIAPSPWSKSTAVLLITGSDPTAVGWAATLTARGGLRGSAVAVSNSKTFTPIQPRSSAAVQQRGVDLNRLTLYGVLPIVSLTILSLAWHAWRQSRRSP